jgi:hypothetical protein
MVSTQNVWLVLRMSAPEAREVSPMCRGYREVRSCSLPSLWCKRKSGDAPLCECLRWARHAPHLRQVGHGLSVRRSPERRTPAGARGERRGQPWPVAAGGAEHRVVRGLHVRCAWCEPRLARWAAHRRWRRPRAHHSDQLRQRRCGATAAPGSPGRPSRSFATALTIHAHNRCVGHTRRSRPRCCASHHGSHGSAPGPAGGSRG